MDNQYRVYENKVKYEPHILEDVVDPIGNGHSFAWIAVSKLALVLEVIVLVVLIGTLNRYILFQVLWFNAVSPFAVLGLVLIPTVWFCFAGTQKRFDENIAKYRFNGRIKKGYERVSKYKKGTPEKAIRGITGIISFDRETGLSEHEVNVIEDKLTLSDHPYKGNWAFDLIAHVELTGSNDVIIENLLEINKSLPDKYFKRVTMYTGQTVTNILDDIEHKLAKRGISPVQEQALYSIYNHYAGRNGNAEPMFLIHIGLPFTIHKKKALEYMKTVRDKYEKPLNEKGVKTVLIQDPELMNSIIHGIFKGIMQLPGDANEY